MEPRFLLVTGSMRSGTTLLSELLYSTSYSEERHPDVAFMGDKSDLLRRYIKTGISDDNINEVKNDIILEIDRFSPVKDKKLIGVKQTGVSIQESKVIEKIFNDHKLIVLQRDPRDIFCSHMERVIDRVTLIDGFGFLLSNLNYYFSHHEDVLKVRYEELVYSPKESIVDVLNFLGLDPSKYDVGSIDKGKIPSNSSYNNFKGKSLAKGSGIDVSSIGKYKRYLSPYHNELISCLFYDFLLEHGYELNEIENPSENFLFWIEIAVKTELDEENFAILLKLASKFLTEKEIEKKVEESKLLQKSYIKGLILRNKGYVEKITHLKGENQELKTKIKLTEAELVKRKQNKAAFFSLMNNVGRKKAIRSIKKLCNKFF